MPPTINDTSYYYMLLITIRLERILYAKRTTCNCIIVVSCSPLCNVQFVMD